MNNEELCIICLEGFNQSNKDDYILECNHKFHTNCIMKWFRSNNSNGNCPICNYIPDNSFNQSDVDDTDISHYYYYNRTYIDERMKHLRKYSRKKISPEILKKEVKKLKSIEQDYIKYKKDKSIFMKDPEIKKIKQQIRQWINKEWNLLNRISKQKHKIVTMYPMIHIH
tara:strand:+ start:570 stop:1076 length:507 start_codon:yes stop_codon:yes gene_type:complete